MTIAIFTLYQTELNVKLFLNLNFKIMRNLLDIKNICWFEFHLKKISIWIEKCKRPIFKRPIFNNFSLIKFAKDYYKKKAFDK